MQCICAAHSLGRSARADPGSQGQSISQLQSHLPESGHPLNGLAAVRFSWGFFLYPRCWHSPTSALAAHEIIPSQHPGCWETQIHWKVSVLKAQQSQLFRSGSWDKACALPLCRHKSVPSSHSLCACATELKGRMNCAGLQLDFLNRIIGLQDKSREFCFVGWFIAQSCLNVILCPLQLSSSLDCGMSAQVSQAQGRQHKPQGRSSPAPTPGLLLT